MERFLKSKLENGSFGAVSSQRSRIMSAIRGKHNKTTELVLKMALVRAGVKGWVLHPATICGKPDFYFPSRRLAVFVDGCFWHGCPRCGHTPKTRSEFWQAKLQRNRERDRKTTKKLKRRGIRVLRMWEHDLNSMAGLQHMICRILSRSDTRS
jgi:DNA mismatch endonuclease (patch repair protein)